MQRERFFKSTRVCVVSRTLLITEHLHLGNSMKQSKDPFEVAFEEQEDSPPDSPTTAAADETDTQTPVPQLSADNGGYSDAANVRPIKRLMSGAASISGAAAGTSKDKEEDDEEEEENMDVELGKLTTGDPDKMVKMQHILSQFTEEQMSRYESFRRSGFQKSNMKRARRAAASPGTSTAEGSSGLLLLSWNGRQKQQEPGVASVAIDLLEQRCSSRTRTAGLQEYRSSRQTQILDFVESKLI